MHKKNNITWLPFFVLIMLMISGVLLGCKGSSDTFTENEVNPQIDVFGVKLYMDEDQVHENVGSKGERAMCVYGYEYEYAEKSINIGFNSETNKVRRITTKNPETTIYDIKPGVELEKAYELIEQKGFQKDDDDKYKFHQENILLTIISMHGTKADGITIEINPES